MAKLLKPNGDIIEVTPVNGSDFSVPELHALLNCTTIEYVRLDNRGDRFFIIDEDGKRANKPVNQLATLMYAPGHDVIVGNVLYCKRGEVL